MFVAHLPAGYLSTRCFADDVRDRAFVTAALVGSVFPDVDMIYFYVPVAWGGGGQREHHHLYWTHTPAWWLAIAVVVLPLLHRLGAVRSARIAGVFLLNVFVHLVLDTVVGHVRWLYPLDDTMLALFEVPARYPHWILNFVLHWTFAFELVVLAVAWRMASLTRRDRRDRVT